MPTDQLPDALADDEVVRRVVAGDARLFELLMRRHNRRIFRVARSIVRSDDEAEDVMQEAYVDAFHHLAQFEGRAKFSTWLTRIAVHAALARVRHEKRERADGSIDDETSAEHLPMATKTMARDPEAKTSDHELAGLLETAIDALPDAFRTVFVLRAVEELSVAETAEALGIPDDTVKTRFFRARGLLQQALMSYVDAATPSAFDFHLSRCDRVVEGVFRRLGIPHGERPGS